MNVRSRLVKCAFVLIFVGLTAASNVDSEQEQNQFPEFYIGAVVEYKPIGSPWDSSPQELVEKNANNYVNLIAEASRHKADIIVFPEYGLTTLGVPRDRDAALPYLQLVPEIGINPCLTNADDPNNTANFSLVVRNLSCAARRSSIYAVINLGEVQICSNKTTVPCHSDGRRQYNSNVVFDRDGAIVAKYHKEKLYFEDQFEQPPETLISTFKTDFGEFGLIICFDMMFEKPAVQLVAQGVRNIIYPTAWVDELPFLTAIQSQSNWAAGANVNLLASGYHQPLGGQLGSGIFSGSRGALNYTFDPDSGTRLILAEVPLEPGKPISENSFSAREISYHFEDSSKQYHSFLRENLSNYSTEILKFTNSLNVISVCSRHFCCSLEYLLTTKRNTTSELNYRIIALNGMRKVAQETDQFGWQVCGVVRCLNSSLSSCTENDRRESSEDFENIVHFKLTSGPFNINQTMQPALNTLDIHFQLIPFNIFEKKIMGEFVEVSSNSLRLFPIQTIAIINRMYD